MTSSVRFGVAVALAGVALLAAAAARAEVIEEIVAKVNDDIITKTDLQQAEQDMLAEAYRRYAGKDLDEQVKGAKAGLLRNMIDRKLLLHRATRLFDQDKMGDSILSWFKEQQHITNDEDLKKLLDQEGMTVADLKKRLIDMQAPDEVLRVEVRDRISVGDKEVEAYYNEHPKEFEVPAEVTVREIVLLAKDRPIAEVRTDAEKVRAKATAPGADFGAIAKEVSDAGTKTSGGLLGPLKKGDLSPQLEAVAFTLPVGEVSQPLEMPYGFHILKVESRAEDRKRAFEEVRDAVRTRLEDEKFRTAMEDYLKKLWSEADIWVSPKYQNRLSPGPTPSVAKGP